MSIPQPQLSHAFRIHLSYAFQMIDTWYIKLNAIVIGIVANLWLYYRCICCFAQWSKVQVFHLPKWHRTYEHPIVEKSSFIIAINANTTIFFCFFLGGGWWVWESITFHYKRELWKHTKTFIGEKYIDDSEIFIPQRITRVYKS